MSIETPLAIQAENYSAEILRRGIYSGLLTRGSTIGSVGGGLVAATDLQATYAGSGLNVSVSAGETIVPGSSSTTQGGYYLRATAATSISPAAASPSNPRVDLIYAQVQDAAYTGSSNLGTVTIATGTPTGGASLSNLHGAPADPTSSYALAYVLIPQSATSISNSDILNVSTVAGLQLLLSGTETLIVTPGANGASTGYTYNPALPVIPRMFTHMIVPGGEDVGGLLLGAPVLTSTTEVTAYITNVSGGSLGEATLNVAWAALI